MVGVGVETWVQALAATAAVSLVSFVGLVVLMVREWVLRQLVPFLVGFAVGALLGDALIHILPELAEGGGLTVGVSLVTVGAIVGFFVLEKLVHLHHALNPAPRAVHPVAVANLLGDGVHNFVDGAIIAGSFLVGIPLGVTTTIAVVLHEIPQEIGDVGVLLHAGLSRRRVLLFNFLAALTAVAGAVVTLLLAGEVEVERPLLAITAGAFIYIAGADLIPELHRQTATRVSVLQFLSMVAGFAVMGLLLLLE
ncbi:MAG TPA: ZIP family metal transporter [Actinomycetota bacterium]|nr:ZIP family metal transporter [Actinomycetota bacterium]